MVEIHGEGGGSGDRSDEFDRFQHITHRKKTTRPARRIPDPVPYEQEVPREDASYSELREQFPDIEINEDEIDPDLSPEEQGELRRALLLTAITDKLGKRKENSNDKRDPASRVLFEDEEEDYEIPEPMDNPEGQDSANRRSGSARSRQNTADMHEPSVKEMLEQILKEQAESRKARKTDRSHFTREIRELRESQSARGSTPGISTRTTNKVINLDPPATSQEIDDFYTKKFKAMEENLESLNQPDDYSSINTALSKLLNEPLHPNLLNEELPKNFKSDSLTKYDETTDPFDHIWQFQSLVGQYPTAKNAICRLFKGSLKGNAIR